MPNVAFDAVGSLCTGFGGGNLTVSNFTVGSGLNRCLYITVLLYATNTTGLGISSVTYNGVALATVCSRIVTNTSLFAIYRLKNPASGSHAIAVATTGTYQSAAVGALALANVNQTTPEANNNGAGVSSSFDGDFPLDSLSVPISGGRYGFMAGGIGYVNTGEGPPTGQAPFTTSGWAFEQAVNGFGLGIPGKLHYLFYGAYSGASTDMDIESSDGGGFSYNMAGVSINNIADDVVHPSKFIEAPDSLMLIESCDYGRN